MNTSNGGLRACPTSKKVGRRWNGSRIMDHGAPGSATWQRSYVTHFEPYCVDLIYLAANSNSSHSCKRFTVSPLTRALPPAHGSQGPSSQSFVAPVTRLPTAIHFDVNGTARFLQQVQLMLCPGGDISAADALGEIYVSYQYPNVYKMPELW